MTTMQGAINEFNKAFKEDGPSQESPQIPKLVVEEDGPPKGEFSDSNTDRGEFADSASQDSVPKPRKSRINAKDRINQQTRQLNETRAAYNFAMQEIERLKKEKDHYSYQAKQKHDIAMVNHEHALKTDKEYSKKLIKEAIDSGDFDGMVNAQELLAERSAQLATLKIQKSMQPQEEDSEDYRYQPTYQPQYAQQEQEQELEPEIEDFLERNPWLDSRDQGQYRPDLANKFYSLGQELEGKLKYDGRDDYAHPEFLDQVLGEFNTRLKSPRSPFTSNTSNQRNNNMVSPVNRTSGEQHYRSSTNNNPNEMKLSQSELNIALSIPDSVIPGIDKARTMQEKRDLKAYHYWMNNRPSDLSNRPL